MMSYRTMASFPGTSPDPPRSSDFWDVLQCLWQADSPAAARNLPLINATILAELSVKRIAPWVYREVARHGWEKHLSPSVLTALRQEYFASLYNGAREEEETRRLLMALDQAGVETILLKGADLRLRLYGDMAVRPMVDLDLLVDPEDFPLAQQVLFQAGYRRRHPNPRPRFYEKFCHEIFFDSPPGEVLKVDLHWEIRAVAYFYRLTYAFLHRKTISSEFKGVPIKVLKPELALLHLSLHAFNDLYEYRLTDYEPRQLLDLILMIRHFPLDWPQVVQEGAQCHCLFPVFQVLKRINQHLPGSIPAEILKELACYRPSAPERILLARPFGYLTTYLRIVYYYSIRDWLAFLAAKLWPDSDYISAETSLASRSAYIRQFLKKFSKSCF